MKILGNGMIFGNDPIISTSATVNNTQLKSTSTILLNGQLDASTPLTQGGAGRPTISSLVAGTSFTEINLGTCTTLNWMFMP